MRNDSSAAQAVSADREVLEPLARVSRQEGLDPLAARLLELRHWLVDDLTSLDGAIDGIDRDVAMLTPVATQGRPSGELARRAARYLLDRPGKRIRPLCVMLAARIGGRRLDPVVRNLAVACELVHAATLLHDDVIDQGMERRGAPTSRVIYGNSASILAGDHLLIEALRLTGQTEQQNLLTRLLDVISEMVTAEAMQLEQRGAFQPNRDVYLRVIHGKTAALFRWGLYAGGTVAGLDEGAVHALARAGDALGMAFQLIDDVLDLEGDPAVTGKLPLADLREGKLTWPVIIAAEQDPELSADIASHVQSAEAAEDTPAGRALVERIRASGALEAARAYADLQGEKALSELARLPESRARRAIELVVSAAIHRSC